jgi:hypothetical protein
MESHPVLTEALTLLLEKRQGDLAAAERVRESAERALNVATENVQQARRMVEEVYKLLPAHSPHSRDREFGSVWSKEVVGPLTAAGQLIGHDFNSQVDGGSGNLIAERWELQQKNRATHYLRRSRPWKEQVTKRLIELLEGGKRDTASNLYAALEAEGVDFSGISNPVHRLTQIMSADPSFEANRAEGWGLSGKDNANDSASPGGAVEE